MDKKNPRGINNPEDEIEEVIEDIIEDDECRYFNFLINASNQANLIGTRDLKHNQVNAVFVMIHPYYIKNLDLKDLNLIIEVNEEGNILVEDCELKALEIQPGVKVFGIIKNSGE